MFFRSISIVFVIFKLIIVVAFYVYNSTIICFHCVKSNYKKLDCFDLNKLFAIRIYEIMNDSNEKMKEISKFVDEKKKV